MKGNAEIRIPPGAETILRMLNEAGHEASVVGGCVRDALLGRIPHDWDICTSAKPTETVAVFSGQFPVIETGIRHGTVTVVVAGEPFEITTYRIDGAYADNRHPDSVSFTTSLKEDLARRDFTINAMAYSPSDGLCDPFHGREDLAAGWIRAVGDPGQRFHEDGLRVMRALRFSATYGFTIEPATSAAVQACRNLLKNLSAERLRDELCKLLMGKDAERILLDYREVMAVVIPELESCFSCPQNSPWHDLDVYSHLVRSVALAEEDLIVRLTMLLHDIGKPACRSTDENGIGHFYGHASVSTAMADEILRRLRFANETRAAVTQLVKWHDVCCEREEKAVRRQLSRLGEEQFHRWIKVQRADVFAQAPKERQKRLAELDELETLAAGILAEKQPLTLHDLAVNGDDLIALGIVPGPELGAVLQKLLDHVLEVPEDNTKEKLLRMLS